jgi:threonine synthase
MTHFIGYRCSSCSAEYLPDQATYTCPKDGGNLDVVLNYENIQQHWLDNLVDERDGSLWRYLPLLPVADPGGRLTPLRAAGWTPVFSPSLLAQELGLKRLWIKDESRNPTASFKDRASAVVVARAREIGAEVIVTASTGNAGAALAGMAAAVGQQAVIFAPQSAPPAKIAQLLIYGAEVILVDDNYDAAFDLSIRASEEFGWYCRNTGYNPFTAEGKKTAAFEIWEFCKDIAYNVSALNIFVSVGDGNIISGIHKGFKDLYVLGLIEQVPRIFGIQSDGSAAIANAYKAGNEEILPVVATTRADSISVDLPRDGLRALRAATLTGGAYITVSDEDIIKAIAELGKVGIFAEPAGATSYAGLVEALKTGIINPDDPVFVLNTGSGLKDVKAAMEAAGQAPVIKPNLDAVKAVLGR